VGIILTVFIYFIEFALGEVLLKY